jgi:tetratricopeptide (TPR) repeat protein
VKRLIIISFLLLIWSYGCGQEKNIPSYKDEISNAFKIKDYPKVIKLCNEKLKQDSTDINALLGVGRAYTGMHDFNLAIPYLLKVQNNSTTEWQLSWSLVDLMTSYYGMGRLDKSKEYYIKALNVKGTKSSESSLKELGLLFGFDSLYKNWETIEKDNIIFHFQKSSSIGDLEKYMKERENAFLNINQFFSARLPKKIDFFVWKSNAAAKKNLKTSAGFTIPQYCISHNRSNQTVGHEIAHSISFWREKNNIRTRLINEGIGVYFDQSNSNHLANAKKNALEIKVDVKDMWINGENYEEHIFYPVAAVWVGTLILFDEKKFLALSKNQTYENALIIYGDGLNSMIEEFNKKINSQK